MAIKKLLPPHPRRDRLLFALLRRLPAFPRRSVPATGTGAVPAGFPVTDQRRLGGLRLGKGDAARAGCGAAALYNAQLLLGLPASLPAVCRSLEQSGALMAGGCLGTDPFRLERALPACGLRGRCLPSAFRLESECPPGAMVLAACWNRACRPLAGVHLFLAVRQPDGGWQSWNRWYAPGPVPAADTADLLAGGRFITGWLLTPDL